MTPVLREFLLDKEHQQLRIYTVEYGTGGSLRSALAEIPGGGTVLSEESDKQDLLEWKIEELTKRHGLVSRQVAEAFATGASEIRGGCLGVRYLGLACVGPVESDPSCPVGGVWVSVAEQGQGVVGSSFKRFFGDWEGRRSAAVELAINLLEESVLP